MLQHLADKNIALDLVRVTEAAALASAVNIGRGDKEAVDQDAVHAHSVPSFTYTRQSCGGRR